MFRQNGWTPGSVVAAGRSKARPVPVPLRLGDPSTIKHVFLMVKDNRTYDQLFGDDARGDGDPALADFVANVTPNQHAMTQQFDLYDKPADATWQNLYCDTKTWRRPGRTPRTRWSPPRQFPR